MLVRADEFFDDCGRTAFLYARFRAEPDRLAELGAGELNMRQGPEEPISSRSKWLLLIGAWVLVVCVSMVPYPSQILLAPFFPAGLMALLPHGDEKAIAAWMRAFPCIVGWVFYVFVSIGLIRAKRKSDFVLSYGLLCVVLAMNVVGCKKVLGAAAGIH